jgi:predicted nucleic acid-binding protein
MANIFLDTAPVIYLIEKHPQFGVKVQTQLLTEAKQGSTFATSVATLMEFSVVPERAQQLQPITDFHRLMASLGAPLHAIAQPTAELAAKLRARYPALKGMDALQISSALQYGCDTFLTNDRKLKQVSELRVLLVEEL